MAKSDSPVKENGFIIGKTLGFGAVKLETIEKLIADGYVVRNQRELQPTAKASSLLTLLRGLDPTWVPTDVVRDTLHRPLQQLVERLQFPLPHAERCLVPPERPRPRHHHAKAVPCPVDVQRERRARPCRGNVAAFRSPLGARYASPAMQINSMLAMPSCRANPGMNGAGRCCVTRMGTPIRFGEASKKLLRAWIPPVDAPIASRSIGSFDMARSGAVSTWVTG